MAGVVTQFTKITVGRPRPGTYALLYYLTSPHSLADIIDRCQPPSGSVDPTFGLSTEAICTQTDLAIVKDGFRSFPSGHSSLSFAGLGFLAFYLGKLNVLMFLSSIFIIIYLAGKVHLFDRKGYTVSKDYLVLPVLANCYLYLGENLAFHWSFFSCRSSRNFADHGLST